jgi:hypothetical protein
LITAVLFGLALGGEMLLPLLEEVAMLAFEWAHKTLDILFTDVFGFGDDASQKASAWTGLLLILGLLGWGGYVLRQKYLRAKTAAPRWWAEQKAEWKVRWAALPWFTKLAYVVGYAGLVGILAMFI